MFALLPILSNVDNRKREGPKVELYYIICRTVSHPKAFFFELLLNRYMVLSISVIGTQSSLQAIECRPFLYDISIALPFKHIANKTPPSPQAVIVLLPFCSTDNSKCVFKTEQCPQMPYTSLRSTLQTSFLSKCKTNVCVVLSYMSLVRGKHLRNSLFRTDLVEFRTTRMRSGSIYWSTACNVYKNGVFCSYISLQY